MTNAEVQFSEGEVEVINIHTIKKAVPLKYDESRMLLLVETELGKAVLSQQAFEYWLRSV